MADYKFTQTGEQIQAILNRHLYLHKINCSFSQFVDYYGTVCGGRAMLLLYTTSETPFTKETLRSHVADLVLLPIQGYVDETQSGNVFAKFDFIRINDSDKLEMVAYYDDQAFMITEDDVQLTDDVSQIY